MAKAKLKSKTKQHGGVIKNRRASFDYLLEDGFKFGLVLTGQQVRAIRTNHLSLTGSYINLKDGELWLVGAKITLPASASVKGQSVTTTDQIKLLATSKDISKILSAKNSGRTLIPTEVLNKTKYIKLRASIAKGKKEYDKRETKKQRDFNRQAARGFKGL